MIPDQARRWVVHGRVQGVGFRWYVLRGAQAAGAGGWVRNLEDGSVEVVARGTAEQLSKLEAWVRKGPPGAFVQNITTNDVPHQDVDANSFKIKH